MTQGQHTPGPCERMALAMGANPKSPRANEARSIDSERSVLFSDREELIAALKMVCDSYADIWRDYVTSPGDPLTPSTVVTARSLLSRMEESK